MAKNVAMDFDAVQKDVVTINNNVLGILDDLSKTKKIIEELSVQSGTTDAVSSHIAAKLEESLKLMTDLPDATEEAMSLVKKKAQEIEEINREAENALRNI